MSGKYQRYSITVPHDPKANSFTFLIEESKTFKTEQFAMQNSTEYNRERKGFTFNEQANAYTCSQGAILFYKGENTCRDYVNYVYVSNAQDGKESPNC